MNLPAMCGLYLLHYDAKEAVNFFNIEARWSTECSIVSMMKTQI